MASAAPEPMLAHSVYFRLVDNSPESRQRFVAACRRDLAHHPGTVFFAAGVLADDIDWSVSDRDFDVALHLVFQNKAAHDRYQDSPEHERFLSENGDNWSAVRSLDSYVEGR